MTDRLYYTDSYLRDFDAAVVDRADGGRRIYLDRTAFYPTSGGQPFDTGRSAASRSSTWWTRATASPTLVESPVAGDRSPARRLAPPLRPHAAAHRPAPPLGRDRRALRPRDHRRAFRPESSTLDLDTPDLGHASSSRPRRAPTRSSPRTARSR